MSSRSIQENNNTLTPAEQEIALATLDGIFDSSFVMKPIVHGQHHVKNRPLLKTAYGKVQRVWHVVPIGRPGAEMEAWVNRKLTSAGRPSAAWAVVSQPRTMSSSAATCSQNQWCLTLKCRVRLEKHCLFASKRAPLLSSKARQTTVPRNGSARCKPFAISSIMCFKINWMWRDVVREIYSLWSVKVVISEHSWDFHTKGTPLKKMIYPIRLRAESVRINLRSRHRHTF